MIQLYVLCLSFKCQVLTHLVRMFQKNGVQERVNGKVSESAVEWILLKGGMES